MYRQWLPVFFTSCARFFISYALSILTLMVEAAGPLLYLLEILLYCSLKVIFHNLQLA